MKLVIALTVLLFLFPFRKYFLANWRRVAPVVLSVVAGAIVAGIALPSGTDIWLRLAGTAFAAFLANRLLRELIDRFSSRDRHGP